MANKKNARPSSEPDEPLKAVLLADSFTTKFRPITLERPKVLLPLVNKPMIDHTLSWLESVGVKEVFVFCCAHAEQVKDYLDENQWTKQKAFNVVTIESHDAISAGDALRVIDSHSVIRGDFILISGDTVSNMSLTQALQEHTKRREKNPLAVMTMVINQSKPSPLTHQSRLGNDEILMAIDPETKELYYYEDNADNLGPFITLDKMSLDNSSLHLHNDKQDCYIDICSPEVLSLFTDNFDYQHLRRHFVKGLLVDDIMGYKIFTHEITSSYAARVDNFRSYDTISKDIMRRAAYPFVPDIPYSESDSQVGLDRQGIYKAPEVLQSRSAQIHPISYVGNGTCIGENSHISNSVIGQGCTIGRNVTIQGSYIWDNVTIEDDCKISYSVVCDGVKLSTAVVLEPGTILSFKVKVGKNILVPAYSKVSLLPQPSREDSDEELEYADANSGVIESPSITSMRKLDLMPNSVNTEDNDTSEGGITGAGYIWSACEPGQEEWRYSVAPIPNEKHKELHANLLLDYVESSKSLNFPQTFGEFIPVSDGDDEDSADYRDSADFQREVEATFGRALTGVDQDNVIIEINSLRLSYNMSHADCAGALFYSVMKSAYDCPYSTQRELFCNAVKGINEWKGLLKNYLRSRDEEIEVILKFEEMCIESTKKLSPLFTTILNRLYDNDMISEDAILTWATEKEGADECDRVFVRQADQFITWLREASEEEEDE